MTVTLNWQRRAPADLVQNLYRDTAPFDSATLPAVYAALTNGETSFHDRGSFDTGTYYYMLETVNGAEKVYSDLIAVNYVVPDGPPVVAGHPIWRIQFNANSNATIAGLYEVTMNGEQPTGGTATANAIWSAGNEPPNAVDGNVSTRWIAPKSGAWWQYEFSGSFDLTEFTIRTGPTSGTRLYAPSDFDLQWSDDGVLFTTQQNYSGLSWAAGQTRTFTVD